MVSRMFQRRGTAAEFQSANPTLDAGETGVEIDTGIIKFGDGVTAWNDLEMAWLPTGGGTITGTLTVPAPTIAEDAGVKVDVDDIDDDLQATKVTIPTSFKDAHFFAEFTTSLQIIISTATTLPMAFETITQGGGFTLKPSGDPQEGGVVVPRDGILFGYANFSTADSDTTSENTRRLYRVWKNSDTYTIGRQEVGMIRESMYIVVPFLTRVVAGDVIVASAYSLNETHNIQTTGDGGTSMVGFLL